MSCSDRIGTKCICLNDFSYPLKKLWYSLERFELSIPNNVQPSFKWLWLSFWKKLSSAVQTVLDICFIKNVKPPLSLPGGVFISSPFEQGGGGLFKWEMMMVKKENTKWKILITRSWSSWSRGSESNPNFQVVNKPSGISPYKVLETWLINTVNHLLLKNN